MKEVIDIETRLKESTSKLSDIFRTLALAFIGIIWIINGEQFPLYDSSKTQLIIISVSLLIDIMQYLILVVFTLLISYKREKVEKLNGLSILISYFCLFSKIALLVFSGILIIIDFL